MMRKLWIWLAVLGIPTLLVITVPLPYSMEASDATLCDTQPKAANLNFVLKDSSGKDFDLASQKGKVIVLDFWATWCPPCRKEVPELNAIYKKYRARGLVVVGVSVDKVQGDGVKSVRPFAREFKVNYPILMADDALVEAMDLDNIPTTLFIDRKGKTIARLEGRGKSGELAQAAKTLFRD
jgi:thiol-disulfide isomerase/thioredoxin